MGLKMGILSEPGTSCLQKLAWQEGSRPTPQADDSVGPVGMQNLITKNTGVEALCLS